MTEGDSDLESSDSDDKYRELEVNEPNEPRKITQRRLQDQAAWRHFFVKNSDALAKEAAFRDRRHDVVPDEMRADKSDRIIASPREYQIELFERCKAQNTIVVLSTGSGKTLIAAMLLRHTLEAELEFRAAERPKKVAFFLVDKVALVGQQHSALQHNLDYPIGQYCGDTTVKLWAKEFWATIKDRHMAVVCTAAILHKALVHSFIHISEINLLVLDEAHHAKKNHVYARIIRDFYAREPDVASRPRIMGMTASPVDARENLHDAVDRLEDCLNAKIATVPLEALARGLMKKDQQEKTIFYNRLTSVKSSHLFSAIEAEVGNMAQFRRLFTFAQWAATTLGSWPADRLWQMCMTENEISMMVARCERDAVAEPEDGMYSAHCPIYDFDPARVASAIKRALGLFPVGKAMRSVRYLSPKVLLLLDTLEDHLGRSGNGRCIVFVQRRYTAMMLLDVLQQDDCMIPGLRPTILIGKAMTGPAGPLRTGMSRQRDALDRFKDGEFNCLIATSVAEEGIDVPQCDVIIRFDLYGSMIQYVQSKGRARHAESLYINMAEFSNSEQAGKIKQTHAEASLLEKFCSSLSADRIVTCADDADLILADAEANTEQIEIKDTGARITYSQSLEIVNNWVASLPHLDGSPQPVPNYIMTFDQIKKKYTYTLVLPDESPIRSVRGKQQARRKAAKCSAAFELCRLLIMKNLVDGHLQSTFTKILPAMRNARLAVSANKKASYHMRIKPQMWSNLGPPRVLYGAALVLDNPDAMKRSSCPLILLTRECLPDLPTFSLFFGRNQETPVRIVTLPFVGPLHASEKEAAGLAEFTLRIFEDVFTKGFESGPDELPYLIAPSTLQHGYSFDSTSMTLRDMIEWGDVADVQAGEYADWAFDDPDEVVENRFLVDRFDGSRKFFSHRVRHDLTAASLVPDWVKAPRGRRWKRLEHTILNYSNSKWNDNYPVDWRQDQKVVECELIPLRRNLLDESQEPERDATCWVIVQPLRISRLRADVAAMALTLPAIIHRIESHLVALDACRVLELDIRPDLALEAMTKDSDNTDEHGAVQVNLQRGMGSNYERLEFLGDTFLKMATTISLFTQMPTSNEYESHVNRMLLICNKNLFNTAVDKNLQEHIRSCQFDRHSWYPQGLKQIKGGRLRNENKVHQLGDKTVADVCEALIGAAYLTGATMSGVGHRFDTAVRAVTALVRSRRHKQTTFGEYYAQYNMPKWQVGPYLQSHVELARQLKEEAGYQFESPSLARAAFKHPSYPYDPTVPNYQRLEFLGDALLDMACVDFLYTSYPEANPQWLTEHKTAIVSNQFLSCLAVKLGFHRHILTTDTPVPRQIREYVTELEALRKAAESGEDVVTATLGRGPMGTEAAAPEAAAAAVSADDNGYTGRTPRDNKRDGKDMPSRENKASGNGRAAACGYWLAAGEAPKALADVVEAYVGATFVDSGYDYGQVSAFFDANIRPFFHDMALYDSFATKHPVTALQQLLNTEFGCSRWRLMTSEILPLPEEVGIRAMSEVKVVVGLMIHENVVLTSVAASGRYAKVATAKKGLDEFRGLGRDEYRLRVGCDCHASAGSEGGGDPGTAI